MQNNNKKAIFGLVLTGHAIFGLVLTGHAIVGRGGGGGGPRERLGRPLRRQALE
jgi:hypothetical protein